MKSMKDMKTGKTGEYCPLPRALSSVPFESDHIVPRKHGGETVEENLALSRFCCSSFTGSLLTGRDRPIPELTAELGNRRGESPGRDSFPRACSRSGPQSG